MIIWSVLEHVRNLRKIKWCKTCVSGLNALFFGTKSYKDHFVTKASILLQWTQNHWECFGAFRKPSERCKAPKMMIGTFLEHFANLRNVKRCETCVSGLNALFQGTEVTKHTFYSIRTEMMFGSDSEHFANLRHVKWWKTCVSGLNALVRGSELAKHPFYSIGPKMMFGVFKSISLTFSITKCVILVFRAWMHYLGYRSCKYGFVTKASILLHWTQDDYLECFGAFPKP
jgi:hypothetical protein